MELGTPYRTNVSIPLTDIATSAYSSEVIRLVDLGLILGNPDGTFGPKNYLTRAEVAAIFARIK